MNAKETKAWLMELERERLDTSWRTPPMKHQPEPIIIVRESKESKKKREQRDQTFFDAGRYFEGARDTAARLAWNRLDKGRETNGKTPR
jgi:hypothetical protein